jgi:Uma2 family endonuclease
MPVPASLRFTYEDYLRLPEVRQYEILDGELYMVPAPVPYHQRVSRRLLVPLTLFVEDHQLGVVLDAPIDVVLSATDIVQPDILFVGRERLDIIGETHLTAAPDLVVEILSPATALRDRTTKAKLYARHGVRELWLADVEARTIEILTNAGAGFERRSLFSAVETLTSPLLPGLEIPLVSVF